MVKHRIIYRKSDMPGCWVPQRRILLLFWQDISGAFSSATSAGWEIQSDIEGCDMWPRKQK